MRQAGRIDKPFEYLINRYPTPALSDLMVQLNEVQTIVSEIADFTQQRKKEPTLARKHETTLLAQAEKRRAINRSRTGFYPTPEDFSPFFTARRSDCCSLTSSRNRCRRPTTNCWRCYSNHCVPRGSSPRSDSAWREPKNASSRS